MKAGRLPARRKGGRGAKGRDLGGHAPRCCSVSDWTREPSHFGFEAGGGKGRSQNTPLTPRRLLIGRGVAAFGFGRLAVELPARLACGLAVPGSASAAVVTEVAATARRYVGLRPGSRRERAGGRAVSTGVPPGPNPSYT